MPNVSIQIDATLLAKLDVLAHSTGRNRDSLICEAIENYVAAQEWQVEEILQGIEEADRGDFASDEEVQRTIHRLKGKG